MRIIAIYNHEKYGRVYLWSISSYEYSVGSVSKNIRRFIGIPMEEVKEDLANSGFVEEVEP
jgi:hypothetical protein